MRELLCVPQSSKERLRRSRTESSGATPAIEELAGEARQVRPAGPRADQYQPGSDFSRAGRSGGRPALRLPRATFSHRRSACRPHTDHTQQKSEISASVSFTPIRRGLEGARPSGSHEHHFLTEGQPAAPIPTIHSRSRKFPLRYRSRPFATHEQHFLSVTRCFFLFTKLRTCMQFVDTPSLQKRKIRIILDAK